MVLNNFLEKMSEKRQGKDQAKKFIFLFLFCQLLFICFSVDAPIGDFGNYYYGSKLFLNGVDPLSFYKDIHFFNSQIRSYETGPFFENYTPVPPFSLLFYFPFLLFKSAYAKLLFNLLSAFAMSFSLYRIIARSGSFNYWFYLLPLLFFQPLYSNYQQGQAYVFVTALLLEFFMAYTPSRSSRAGFILALLFCLKIFPAFMVIIPLVQGRWRIIVWFLLVSAVFHILGGVVAGAEVLVYYYGTVLPRLSVNEMTEPFSYANQSLHAFLLQVFVYYPGRNPYPAAHLPLVAVILQWCFYGLTFAYGIVVVKRCPPDGYFFVVLLLMALLNKYCTVYSLVMLLPFIFLSDLVPARRLALLTVLLFLASQMPVAHLGRLPVIFQYSRFWLLLLVFILLMVQLQVKLQPGILIATLVIFFFPSLIFYRYQLPVVELQPCRGILYDYQVGKSGLKLYSCLGWKDTVESIDMKLVKIDSLSLKLKGSAVVLGKEEMYRSQGQLRKPMLLNETELLVMSDEHRGIGMFGLVVKPINTKPD